MANPRVSVIIPYFNAGRFIEGALASIRRQAYAPLEILLVDDGSTDDIAKRVKTWGEGIVFLQQENRGPAAARNLAIRNATGDIIAFLDADDQWPDGKLSRQVACLQQDQTPGVIAGLVQYAWIGIPEPSIASKERKRLVQGHLGARLVRKWVFDEVGLFNEDLRFNEDLDWHLRVRERGIPVARSKDVALIHQRHDANLTLGLKPQNTNVLRVLKKSFDRRKAIHNGQVPPLPPILDLDDERPQQRATSHAES